MALYKFDYYYYYNCVNLTYKNCYSVIQSMIHKSMKLAKNVAIT